jgi:hypothetical protein
VRAGPRGPRGETGTQGLQGFAGLPGPGGSQGLLGATGAIGASGPTGAAGVAGSEGLVGPGGPAGVKGVAGSEGLVGPAGPAGAKGATGPEGPPGLPAFAEFYALMGPDNAATVGAGIPVQFPRDGPTTGVITRRGGVSFTEFVLPNIGTYRVAFSVSVTEAGQLVLALDSGGGMLEQAYTVYGRATGASPIAGEALVTTTVAKSALELRNPTGNTPALTITPSAGGTHAAAASIVIQQLV